MRVCVFGAGAVGSYLAAKMAGSGQFEVSAVGRGEHLRAIRRDGIRLISDDGEQVVPLAAAEEDSRKLPPQDLVFVTLKAPSQPGAAEALHALLKPEGHAVFVANGVPWWWNYGLGTGATSLPRLDPEGLLWNRLGPQRAIGCIVYSGNHVTAPGTVRHQSNNRWVIGEPDGATTPRLALTAEALRTGGLNAEITDDLRLFVWRKLLRNTPFNTLAALTRLTVENFVHVPELLELAQTITDEIIQIAGAMGWQLPPTRALEVIEAGGRVGPEAQGAPAKPIRPSMLIDVVAGRSMELEALVGQVRQFAREVQAPTPGLDAIYPILAGIDLYNQQFAPLERAEAQAHRSAG
jgi:2-dehydropantoate 2-reductase